MKLEPEIILRVAEQTRLALAPHVDADWSHPAHQLEMSCWKTAEHLADSFFSYAACIVGQPTEWFVPAELRAETGNGPREQLQVIDACAALFHLAAVAAGPGMRAFHSWGMADVDGFLAMGTVEGLVHTWDISTALGGAWHPPAELSRPAIERLFPGAPLEASDDAGDVLLWCTGRIALTAHERQQNWRWYSAPPAERGDDKEGK